MPIISPNMSLPIPVVGVDTGSGYATNIDNSLTIIDAHNHTPGSGVLVPTSGLNINADLSIQSNNLTAARSLRFFNQVSPIASVAPDQSALYTATVSSNSELFYNDSSGHQIQITSSGSVLATSSGIASGTASASFVAGNLTVLSAPATPGNIDAATLIVRYPGSYPTPSGNYIAIEAPSSLSSGYALTLPALPSVPSVMTLSTAGVISTQTYNQIASNITRTTGTSVGVGGVAVSASSGNFSTSSNSLVPVTNLSVTITTNGNPVVVGLSSDCTGSGLSMLVPPAFGADLRYALLNGSSTISSGNINSTNQPSSVISALNIVPAGTYTYSFQISADANQSSCTYSVLYAYELH